MTKPSEIFEGKNSSLYKTFMKTNQPVTKEEIIKKLKQKWEETDFSIEEKINHILSENGLGTQKNPTGLYTTDLLKCLFNEELSKFKQQVRESERRRVVNCLKSIRITSKLLKHIDNSIKNLLKENKE